MKRLALALAVVWPLPGAAHDFWVQPDAYQVGARQQISMNLMVGHGPSRQRSPIPSRRIARFEAVGPGGARTDLRSSLHLGGATDGEVRFERPGAYVMVLETDDRAQNHQPAERFNQYLVQEGLALAISERQRQGRVEADGSEIYSRAAKAIVLVGPRAGSAQHVTAAVGLRLEIVPEQMPEAAARLPVLVLCEGVPLEGALVKLTDLAHDETPLEAHQTDAHGGASFTVPGAGTWLLNVVWSRPLPDSPEAELETVFSSLTFATRPPRHPAVPTPRRAAER